MESSKTDLYLSLGSNLGNRRGNIDTALELLEKAIGTPPEAVSYRNALAVLFSVAALFGILYKSATAIAPASHDELFVFPKPAERILNVLFRLVFGIAVSTLIFVLCCATPVNQVRHAVS